MLRDEHLPCIVLAHPDSVSGYGERIVVVESAPDDKSDVRGVYPVVAVARAYYHSPRRQRRAEFPDTLYSKIEGFVFSRNGQLLTTDQAHVLYPDSWFFIFPAFWPEAEDKVQALEHLRALPRTKCLDLPAFLLEMIRSNPGCDRKPLDDEVHSEYRSIGREQVSAALTRLLLPPACGKPQSLEFER
jgi:hypothetical protein